jgi:spermidine synthase
MPDETPVSELSALVPWLYSAAMPVSRKARRRSAAPAHPDVPEKRSPARIWAALALAGVIAVGGAYLLWPSPLPRAAGNPAQDGLIEKVESLYNDISVYRQQDGKFLLLFGAKRLRYIESIVDPDDALDLPVNYTQSMGAGLAYATGLDDAAAIGLGGGGIAWYQHKSLPGLRTTAIELDPEVVRLAGQYFKVRAEPNFDIATDDGRVYLTHSDQRFDIILIDAYRGPFVPFHLLTTEFYKLVAAHLKPGGVAVQNVEPTTMLFDSAVATIRQAFAHLVFLRGDGNIVILAYNGPEQDEATVQRLAAERQAAHKFRYDLAKILERRFSPSWKESTQPLTDDFAPVEYLKAIERHNEKQS